MQTICPRLRKILQANNTGNLKMTSLKNSLVTFDGPYFEDGVKMGHSVGSGIAIKPRRGNSGVVSGSNVNGPTIEPTVKGSGYSEIDSSDGEIFYGDFSGETVQATGTEPFDGVQESGPEKLSSQPASLQISIDEFCGNEVICWVELSSGNFIRTSFSRSLFPEGLLVAGKEYTYDPNAESVTEKRFEFAQDDSALSEAIESLLCD